MRFTIVTEIVLAMIITGCAGAQREYSVVNIYVTGEGVCDQITRECGPVRTRGTGWFVERNLIMTAGHVVRESATNEVEVGIRGVSEKGYIEYVSDKSDLALISVEGTGERPFELCDKVEIDTMVYIQTYNGIILTRPPGIIVKMKNGDILSTVISVGGNSGSPTLKGEFWNQCVVGTLWGGNDNTSLHSGLSRMRECLAEYRAEKGCR